MNTEHCVQQGSKNRSAGQNLSECRTVLAPVGCVHVVIVDVDSVQDGVQGTGPQATQLLDDTDLADTVQAAEGQGSLELIKVRSWSRTMCTAMYCASLPVVWASLVSLKRNSFGMEALETLVFRMNTSILVEGLQPGLADGAKHSVA